LAAINKLDGYLSRGGRLSPQSSFHDIDPISEVELEIASAEISPTEVEASLVDSA